MNESSQGSPAMTRPERLQRYGDSRLISIAPAEAEAEYALENVTTLCRAYLHLLEREKKWQRLNELQKKSPGIAVGEFSELYVLRAELMPSTRKQKDDEP